MASRKKTSKRQPEYLLEKKILTWLNSRGFFAWKNKNGATYDPVRKCYRKGTTLKGISDILGILWDGRFLAIEVKMPKGRVTKEQKAFLERINERRGIAFVARSIEDVEKHLQMYAHQGYGGEDPSFG